MWRRDNWNILHTCKNSCVHRQPWEEFESQSGFHREMCIDRGIIYVLCKEVSPCPEFPNGTSKWKLGFAGWSLTHPFHQDTLFINLSCINPSNTDRSLIHSHNRAVLKAKVTICLAKRIDKNRRYPEKFTIKMEREDFRAFCDIFTIGMNSVHPGFVPQWS